MPPGSLFIYVVALNQCWHQQNRALRDREAHSEGVQTGFVRRPLNSELRTLSSEFGPTLAAREESPLRLRSRKDLFGYFLSRRESTPPEVVNRLLSIVFVRLDGYFALPGREGTRPYSEERIFRATRLTIAHCQSTIANCFCAPGGSRTPNPQIRSLMLYPVELRAQSEERYPPLVWQIHPRMTSHNVTNGVE